MNMKMRRTLVTFVALCLLTTGAQALTMAGRRAANGQVTTANPASDGVASPAPDDCHARPKVGLVLGGGGAKGAAAIGVLKVLEEAGVRPDYIAGTSIGAIVGALYAAGYQAAELEELFCQQEWLSLLTDRRADLSGDPMRQVDGVTYVFGFPVISRDNPSFGMLRGGQVEQMVDSMLLLKHAGTFDSLRVPFRCVAAELKNALEVVIGEDVGEWAAPPRVARAVRASMAIPGLFKPAQIDGRMLVDGGMMNNLPVDVVLDMGADIVIAIDLQQAKHADKRSKDNLVSAIGDWLGLGPLANWIATRPDISKYNVNRRLADVYINPPLPDDDMSNFGNKNMARMVQVGQKAAREQLEKLRSIAQETSAGR